eukprot:2683911-Prymnesium_polylepis.1
MEDNRALYMIQLGIPIHIRTAVSAASHVASTTTTHRGTPDLGTKRSLTNSIETRRPRCSPAAGACSSDGSERLRTRSSDGRQAIDVEDHVMNVLETMPWGRLTVDVVLAECPGQLLLKRCENFLKSKGSTTLPCLRFGGDVLAVRKPCLT